MKQNHNWRKKRDLAGYCGEQMVCINCGLLQNIFISSKYGEDGFLKVEGYKETITDFISCAEMMMENILK